MQLVAYLLPNAQSIVSLAGEVWGYSDLVFLQPRKLILFESPDRIRALSSRTGGAVWLFCPMSLL